MIIHYDMNNKMQADRWTKNGKTDTGKTDKFCPYSIVQVKHMIVDIFMNIKLYQWKSKIMKYLRDIIDTIYNTAIYSIYSNDKPTTISTQILREDVMLIEPKINSTEQTTAEFTK